MIHVIMGVTHAYPECLLQRVTAQINNIIIIHRSCKEHLAAIQDYFLGEF